MGLSNRPPTRCASVTAIYLALSLITYLVVLGLLVRRPRFGDQSRRMLFLYLLLALSWTVVWGLIHVAWPGSRWFGVAGRILDYGLLLLALFFHQLSRAFLHRTGPGRKWWALGLGWLLLVVMLHENIFRLPPVTLGRLQLAVPALGLALLAVGWGFFMGRACLLTLSAYRQTRQPLHRNRYRYWVLTLALVVGGAALHLARFEPWGVVFHHLGALSAAYLMLTYQLPDSRGMIRAGATGIITVLMALIVYPVGFVLTDTVFRPVKGYTSFIGAVGMALVLAGAFSPTYRLVQRWVNRLTAGAEYDSRLTVREYSSSISNILDLAVLAGEVVRLTGQSLGAERGALLIVRPVTDEDGAEGFQLDPVPTGDRPWPAGRLATDGPVVRAFRERRPLTQYDVDLLPRFKEIAPRERDWLASLEADIFVPICTQDAWIGLLALGPKTSGDRYYNEDVLLLGTLADQTAVALQNARLVDDLRVRHEENLKLTEQLRAANRELTQLDQAKSNFIDIVSHELRTPLTLVRGYNDILRELLAEGALTPDTGRDITMTVHEAALRLEQIVSTMLDVSLIDSETLALKLFEIPLSEVIRPVVKSWQDALRQRHLSLAVQGVEDLPPIIADPGRLERVFSCLLQNAIKFTPDGGHIRIVGTLLDMHLPPDERAVQIMVADTGIGIASENLERIFEKFYRVGDVLLHSSGDAKFKGAGPGLGLTLARGIVEAHGGYIWAESGGQDEHTCPGSEFYVVLPVVPPNLQEVGSHDAAESEPGAFVPEGDPLTPAGLTPGPAPAPSTGNA
jgi:signal transduction histidine kinase